jgi:hypothetical protein
MVFPLGRKDAIAAFNSAQGIGNRASCLILFAQLEPWEMASSAAKMRLPGHSLSR